MPRDAGSRVGFLVRPTGLAALSYEPPDDVAPAFIADAEFAGLAGGPGFEPGLLGPEPRVLPLNYPPRHGRAA